METTTLSKYANAILKAYWNGTLPVDPFILVRAARWKIVFSDSLSESSMDFYIDPEERCVYMNSSLLIDAYASRVACAKALAYVVTSSREVVLEEQKATDFAAEILIPDLFLGLMSEENNPVEHFAVTSGLVSVRRKQMTSGEYASTTGFRRAELSK